MRTQVTEKLTILITSAFGLVAALAWNDTVKLLIASIVGKPDSLLGMFIYASIVTVLAVVVAVYVGKLNGKK